MLSSTPINQKPLNEQDQALVTEFNTWANNNLSTKPVSIYMNRNCELVYLQEDQKPLIGFASIYHFAREMKHEIPDEFAQRLDTLEATHKNVPMRNMKLWRLLEEYKNPHPDMRHVIEVLCTQNQRKPQDPFATNREDKYYPFINPSAFEEFLDEGPEYLDVYLDAMQLPELRQLITCLWQLREKKLEELTFFAGMEVKDHQQLMSCFPLEFKKQLQIKQTLQTIVDKFRKLIKDNVPSDQLDELIKLMMNVGKKYSRQVKVYVDMDFGTWHVGGGPFSSLTLEEMFLTYMPDKDVPIRARMAIRKLQEVLKNQPEDLLVLSSEDSVAMPEPEDLTSKHLRLLDELIFRIEFERAKFPQAEKQQILRLIQMVDGVSLSRYNAKIGHFIEAHRDWDARTLLKCTINAGDIEVFEAIWNKIQQAVTPPDKPDADLIPFVAKADLTDDIKKHIIKLFFAAGADVPDMSAMAEHQVKIIKQAYVECFASTVADEMDVIDSHLTQDTTNLVEYFCREVSEVVQPARQLVTQRLFARSVARAQPGAHHDEPQVQPGLQ